MTRPLTSTIIQNPNDSIDIFVEVDGWRIEVRFDADSNVRSPHHMVNITNVGLDGEDGGWCACAYDSSVPVEDHVPLMLDGSERE